MSDRLQERLQLDDVGNDRFSSSAPGAPVNIYGGELAAHALVAANMTVTDDRLPHSLHCTYLAAGDPAHGLEHQVTRIRDGRSFSVRRVDVFNGGRLSVSATVSYQTKSAGVEHRRTAPRVPCPDDLPTFHGASNAAWIPWAEENPELEMRVAPHDPGDSLGRRTFWLKIRHDPAIGSADDLLEAAYAAYASDFTMIASIRLPHEEPDVKTHVMTTLTHSLYFHKPFAASQWHLVDHWSPAAAGGRGLSIAHAYNASGDLTMTAVQESLVRSASKKAG
ncbi:acyl-CoA thioesterase domain-containing protein [Mycobacterium sp. UM_CSW]|uniref:acyl-CoA thioesterase n=1 Tax=Mycobacterium sp. UM_CSW TaxID=1370119 RepID=UPI00042A68E4|nr:acyl-CoA thioesterase domain-containing protein [Mycobacterium sp. UM_CSW]